MSSQDPRDDRREATQHVHRPSPIRPRLRVATILDDFTRTALQYEFTNVDIDPESWEDRLRESLPDMLFVESAFRGLSGSWGHLIARFGQPAQPLTELVEWCRQRSIPTVFWNKEDPANFEWFAASASLFDYVFTVDYDSIERYQHLLGHDRIGVLPFAAQPALHYPSETPEARDKGVAFAGAYYAQKHPERRQQMETILDPAREFGLEIYDRMGNTDDPRFRWPAKYRDHIVGSLSYEETLEAYRRHKVFLNVNTVTDSPTMCARRIFELAASGTPIVSGRSRAIEEMVPEGIVQVSTSKEQTRSALERLVSDPHLRAEVGAASRAWVLQGNTYSDRIRTVLETVGLPSHEAAWA